MCCQYFALRLRCYLLAAMLYVDDAVLSKARTYCYNVMIVKVCYLSETLLRQIMHGEGSPILKEQLQGCANRRIALAELPYLN